MFVVFNSYVELCYTFFLNFSLKSGYFLYVRTNIISNKC